MLISTTHVFLARTPRLGRNLKVYNYGFLALTLSQPEKKVVGIISRNGRFLAGEPYEKVNFQDNHFKGLMNFIGVQNVFIEVLQDVFNHAELQNKLKEATERVKALAIKL